MCICVHICYKMYILYAHISYFIHCNIVWSNTISCLKLKRNLHTLQKRTVRLINNVPIDYHTNDLFYRNKLLKLITISIISLLVLWKTFFVHNWRALVRWVFFEAVDIDYIEKSIFPWSVQCTCLIILINLAKSHPVIIMIPETKMI